MIAAGRKPAQDKSMIIPESKPVATKPAWRYDTASPGAEGLRAQALYSQGRPARRIRRVVPELASRDHVRKLLPLVR